MKQVWKCDHCSYTDVKSDLVSKHEPECCFNKATKHCYTCKYDLVSKHEPECCFNKATKHCYTCKYSREDGYDEHIAGCDINEDTFRGEEEGNCPGWVYEYLEEERDSKIENILK